MLWSQKQEFLQLVRVETTHKVNVFPFASYHFFKIYSFVIAAALALLDIPDHDAETIVRKSMKIAGDICVYTNHNIIVEKLERAPEGTVVAPPAAQPTSL